MEQFIAFLGNHPMLTAAWVGIFLAIIVMTIRIKLSPIKQLSPQELTFLVNRQDGVVVDIRTEKEFKAARIIDAKHLPSDKAKKDDFSTLEKLKDKPIILVCAAGVSASNVANKMSKSGFGNVSVLKGGMGAWTGAGLPVTKNK
ncbi:rhodanese-like domain-containing protein [Thalassotalea sediminis]|uniref:rhodanese-like domain-containing protein n=1 Tax=Thalassotalea sediminis TaxID=1759089 RepID=UPI002573ED2A|nr:rhodanese-like domain-containing protein [Thalassotalea sediminis]